MSEVIIDGVRYVPVSDSNPNAKAIMHALVEQWWGELEDDATLIRYAKHLRVVIGDNFDEEDGETVEEFVARLFADHEDHPHA